MIIMLIEKLDVCWRKNVDVDLSDERVVFFGDSNGLCWYWIELVLHYEGNDDGKPSGGELMSDL